MPLNPPSYNGQDVWYSPNVYANMVPIALWQPPKVASSLIYSYTLPEPSLAPLSDPAFVEKYMKDSSTPKQREITGNESGSLPNPGSSDKNPAGVDPPNPSNLSLPAGQGQYQTLFNNLVQAHKEAKEGKWKYGKGVGAPWSNENVNKCFKDVGFPVGGSYAPWCAAFVGSMLYRSGIGGKKSASTTTYETLGRAVPLADKSQWRTLDVCVWGYGHVSFLILFDKNVDRDVMSIGGNYSHNVTNEHDYFEDLRHLRRNWEIPTSVTGFVPFPDD